MEDLKHYINTINDKLKSENENFRIFISFRDFKKKESFGIDELKFLNDLLYNKILSIVEANNLHCNKNIENYKKKLKKNKNINSHKLKYQNENYLSGYLWINKSEENSAIITKIIINQLDICSKLINENKRKLNMKWSRNFILFLFFYSILYYFLSILQENK